MLSEPNNVRMMNSDIVILEYVRDILDEKKKRIHRAVYPGGPADPA